MIDIGINLVHDSFDRDRDEVIERARKAGVTRMLITGSSIPSTRSALELVAVRPSMFRATAGIHPHHATDLDAHSMTELTELATNPHVLAVGECGLDYFRNFSPQTDQRAAFEWQLQLAAEMKKPVLLHERDAHADFVSIIKSHREVLVGGVAHCFTGTLEEVRAYLNLDLYIGITGWICDERRGAHLKEVVRHIPAERLLIETDAPYLLPRDLDPKPKDRRNEPAYLPHVLQTIARARGEDPDVLAAITTENALTLFRWTNSPAGDAS